MMNSAPSHVGTILAVRGSVIDIRFDAELPAINTLLRSGKDGKVAIEVWAQLNAETVRGIALTATQGLARGMAVTNTGGPLKAPTGKAILSRMFDVFGNVIDRGERLVNVKRLTGPDSDLGHSIKIYEASPSLMQASHSLWIT
jgi:F-type H+-transporting ATPase subunit beta